MRAGPLIVRELRDQARSRTVSLLRLTGPLLLLLGTTHIVMRPVWAGRWIGPGPWSQIPGGAWFEAAVSSLHQFLNHGATLFAVMNLIVLATIWLLGPLITADALSRERREGTLGLLLLTPLRAHDVVTAKWLAHALRALTAVLATIPVLLIPVLLGGVTWNTVARAVLLDTASLALALSAGMYASILWQGPRAVHLGALLLAGASAFTWFAGWAFFEALVNVEWHSLPEAPGWVVARSFDRFYKGLRALSGLVFDPDRFVWLATSSPILVSKDLLLPMVLVAVAGGLTVLTLRRAARSVESVLASNPAPTRLERLEARISRPRVMPNLLKAFQRACTRVSPVLGLEVRTWRLRVAPWLTLAATGLLTPMWIGIPSALPPALILAAAVSLTAASGLQRDRASGVLELLLTAPGGVRLLLGGKFGGIALQALPSLIFAIAMAAWGSQALLPGFQFHASLLAVMMIAHVAFAAAAGLYFSYRCRSFAIALTATAAAVAIVSAVGTLTALPIDMTANGIGGVSWLARPRFFPVAAILLDVVGTIAFVFLLARSLRTGSFSRH